jgi:hypothetical protein
MSVVNIDIKPSVFVVIINWKGCDDTLDCLNSLTTLTYENFSIVVVENDSGDGSLDRIKIWSAEKSVPLFSVSCESSGSGIKYISKVEPSETGLRGLYLVEASFNTGFCLGNNIGMQIAEENSGDYVFVLNNDTICTQDVLEPLVSFAEENSDVGLMSSLVCYDADKDSIWWAGGDFNAWLSPSYRHQGEDKKTIQDIPPYDSQWATGCASFFPVRIFKEFGGYDESFFIWCDEWDLSLKVGSAGYRIAVVPKSVLYHKVGKSLGITSPLVFFYSFRNMIMLRKRHLPGFKWFVYFAVYFPTKFFKSLYYSLKFRDVRFLLGFFDAMFDGCLGRGGLWKRQSR